jgi:Arc/MetJ-type ribon-helix-helix transcriptional regulator
VKLLAEWKTVSIKQEQIDDIVRVLKTGRYRSISEFISDAIRLRIEELSRLEKFTPDKPQEATADRSLMEKRVESLSSLMIPSQDTGLRKEIHRLP